MRDKWHVKNKKGYLKIHVAVNVKTKKILSMKVTDEHVHDSKALPELVDSVIKSDSMTTVTIGKLFGDGAYEGNDSFRYLADNGILPCIKVRKNARVQWKKGNILRNLSVIAQKKDLQKWKDSVELWTIDGLLKPYSHRIKRCLVNMFIRFPDHSRLTRTTEGQRRPLFTERRGPGLVRLFDETTFKRAAIIAALHAAGSAWQWLGGLPISSHSKNSCSPPAIHSPVLFIYGTPVNPETGLPRAWPEPRANWLDPDRQLKMILKMIGCWRFTNADSLARCTKPPASQINASYMPTCAMTAQDLCSGCHFTKNGLFSTCR